MGCWVCLVIAGMADQTSSWGLELEGGALFATRADVRIPGDTGTRFSFQDDLDVDPAAYVRGRAYWRPTPRQTILATVVPIDVTASGEIDRDIRFADTVFPAGTAVDASYRFNNYRLTYRYRLVDSGHWQIEAGGTLFVRDARIRVTSADATDRDDDLGVVPLLHLRLAFRPCAAWTLLLDGDALTAPQGRALDLFVGAEYAWTNWLHTGAGYRILDGGADNSSVFTFAQFQHAAVTLRAAF